MDGRQHEEGAPPPPRRPRGRPRTAAPLGRAERSRRVRERQREQGLTELCIAVPVELAEDVRRLAAALREEHRSGQRRATRGVQALARRLTDGG